MSDDTELEDALEAPATDATATEPAKTPPSYALRIVLAVTVLAAAVAMGVLGSLLLGAGGSSSAPGGDVRACILDRDFTKGARANCPPKGAKHYDGLIQNASGATFDLTTVDGEELTFGVRKPDRPYIDIQHAQTHASLGLPVRVFVERIDGDDVIVYMENSTLRF